MFRRLMFLLLLLMGLTAVVVALPCPTQYKADGITLKDSVIVPAGIYGGLIHWDADTVYILAGFVYIGDGQVGGVQGELHIDAGTIIKGEPGAAENASALIIARYSKIYAEGEPCCPIVFTAQSDNVDDPFDLGPSDKGLWGSLIILGAAPINTPPSGVNNMEGLPVAPENQYGGTDPHDNSGIIRYVSLRHGGTNIGEGNEINGLTFGGVGDGTVIDYAEAFANNDDGFEFFGGTVRAKHLIYAFCDDDGFDWDQGFTGKLQYLFFVADSISNSDHLFEMDSDDPAFTGVPPFSKPTVYNFTGIGRGMGNTAVGGKADQALKFKEDSGGHLRNGIVVEWPQWGYDLEDKDACQDSWMTCTCAFEDSEKRARCFTSGAPNDLFPPAYGNPVYAVADIDVYSIVWYNLNKGFAQATKPWIPTRMSDWVTQANTNFGQTWPNDVVANPGIYYGPNFRLPNNHALDPRPAIGGPAFTTNHPNGHLEDPWFDATTYVGAFDAKNNWARCWTDLWYMGYFGQTYVCGDANNDPQHKVNIADATFIINYVFVPGSPAPNPLAAGDVNCDGKVNVADATYIINYVFVPGSPAPCANCPITL